MYIVHCLQASTGDMTSTSTATTVVSSASVVTDEGKLELADDQGLQAIQFADGSTAIINQKG